MPYLYDPSVARAIVGSDDGSVAAWAAVRPVATEWAVVFGLCSVSPPAVFSTVGPACMTPLTSMRWAISWRSEEHMSELQSRENLVCRLLLEKKKKKKKRNIQKKKKNQQKEKKKKQK